MKEYSSILGLHAESEFCGVSRFNRILAGKLGIPSDNLQNLLTYEENRVLISIKFSELDSNEEKYVISRQEFNFNLFSDFDVFIHDQPTSQKHWDILRKARHIFCGNSKIHKLVSQHFSNSSSMWSPPTLPQLQEYYTEPESIKFISFGMAHKIDINFHKQLIDWLNSNNISYQMTVSASPHEGEDFFLSSKKIQERFHNLYGRNFIWAGYLGEQILLRELHQSDVFVGFYSDGVRENNSSAIAALSCGLKVITNMDVHSPDLFRNHENAINIAKLQQYNSLKLRKNTSEEVLQVGIYSWEKFLDALRDQG